jgi:hypothetical protein
MWRTVIYMIACSLAAAIPLLPTHSRDLATNSSGATFPGWPTHFEGRTLTRLPLSEREERFGRDFPGKVARFTDGEREIIIRWVWEATRRLHPASDCFEGIGYRVRPAALRVDEAGARWGSFTATRGGEGLRVYERIYRDGGRDGWTDVSSWYWSAALSEKSAGPWWAITVAEKEAAGSH